MACKNGAVSCSWPECGCPVNALGEPAPGRTDFSTWERGNLESFARQAADENLILRTQLREALAAWRREVARP
jgi:hypothetical protein